MTESLLPLLLIGSPFLALYMFRWIFRPIASLARLHEEDNQFTLADLLTLSVMLQGGVGAFHYLLMRVVGPDSSETRGRVLCADVLVAVVIVLCWLYGLKVLSCAGIDNRWCRAVFLAFVLPFGIVSVVLVAPLAVIGIPSFVEIPEARPLIGGIICAFLAVIGACGLLTRWIAAKYPLSAIAAAPGSEPISQPPSTTPGK